MNNKEFSLKNVSLNIFLVIVGMFSGAISFRLISKYKPEPIYSRLQIISKDYFKLIGRKKDERFEIKEYEFKASELLNINKVDDIKSYRNGLRKFLFKSDNLTKDMPNKISTISDKRFESLDNLLSITKLEINSDFKLNSIVYHFIPINNNKKFLIYHHGHKEGFIEAKEYINFFLKNGFNVLAYSMPNYGMNNQPVVKTKYNGFIKLDHHKKYFHLEEEGGINPLNVFVKPVIVGINYIENYYGNSPINFLGFSGGGWSATISAAVDTRIKNTFSVAGGLPISLLSAEDYGDYEMTNNLLYSKFNYLTLFTLATVDEHSKRNYYQIFNQYDPCCFGGLRWKKYENELSELIKKISNDYFYIINDYKNYKHSISEETLSKILDFINKNT